MHHKEVFLILLLIGSLKARAALVINHSLINNAQKVVELLIFDTEKSKSLYRPPFAEYGDKHDFDLLEFCRQYERSKLNYMTEEVYNNDHTHSVKAYALPPGGKHFCPTVFEVDCSDQAASGCFVTGWKGPGGVF